MRRLARRRHITPYKELALHPDWLQWGLTALARLGTTEEEYRKVIRRRVFESIRCTF